MSKHFTWSWSKLSAFETCAFQYLKRDVQKAPGCVDTVKSDQILYGEAAHSAIETSLKTGKPLPADFAPYQRKVDEILAMPGELIVEGKYALKRDLTSTQYLGPLVWFRGRVDAARIQGPVGMAADWKTGRRKPPNEQLPLMAQCLFSNYPELTHVVTRFVWLQEMDDSDSGEDVRIFTRDDLKELWTTSLFARVEKMEEAERTGFYPPTPGGLCKSWCPVSVCEHYKRGAR